jgi:peroxiredoxin
MVRDVQTGTSAPEFRLLDSNGAVRHFSELRQFGAVVLLILPSFEHWFIRRRLRRFLREYDRFVELGADVVVVAPEIPSALFRLRERLELPFVLLSDLSGDVLVRFGFNPMAVTAATVLVDGQGILRYAGSDSWLRSVSPSRLLNLIRCHPAVTPRARSQS